jgi:polyprenyl P-hydroxybenzoate/phenylacrylic acid decarboxylase-like protein
VRHIVLAITGASGAAYARRLAQCLLGAEAHLHLVVSPHGRRILADELGVHRLSPETLVDGPAGGASLYDYSDIGARIASGSFHTDGMVICPCSSNTLAAVAAGTADNLITRAAHVALKETRRLILVPRETPLSQIEIANMLRVSQAGGIICPACPGFYLRPQTVEELVDFVVGRVLDLLAVPHELPIRWSPETRSRPAGQPASE